MHKVEIDHDLFVCCHCSDENIVEKLKEKLGLLCTKGEEKEQEQLLTAIQSIKGLWRL